MTKPTLEEQIEHQQWHVDASDNDSLKALEEKERGDQWETTATNLLTRAEKAESKYAALESKMKDPTQEMVDAGSLVINYLDPHHVFTTMSAVALKEGE